MKKQPYDYSGFSLRRLNEPRFAHVKLLGGWIAYFCMYFITENLIPASRCHPIHCWLDDMIPFNELFAIFYVGWYFLCFGSLAYTFFYDVPRFKKLQTFIMITQAVAMLCYILWPSRQDLRPAVFPRQNFLTDVVAFIYSFDTNTGVCPSLHPGHSVRGPQGPGPRPRLEVRPFGFRGDGVPCRLLCQAALGPRRAGRPAGVRLCRAHGLRKRLLVPQTQRQDRIIPRIE